MDISDDGRVVVGFSESRDNAHVDGREAFVWTPEEGMTGLGFLPGGIRSSARSVSPDGSTVVGWSSRSLNLPSETFQWTREGGLQATENPDGYTSWPGADGSGDGRVIAGIIEGDPRLNEKNNVFRWTEQLGLEVLGTIPWLSDPTDNVLVRGISRDGTTIVGTQSEIVGGRLPYESFVWSEETGFQRIRNPSGYHQNYAVEVSLDGSIVAGELARSDGEKQLTEAFMWTEEMGVIPLGIYHDGSDRSTSASAMTEDGSFIGGKMFVPNVGNQPMIWDAYRGPRLLEELLQADADASEALVGWRLGGVGSISEDGLTFVGGGLNPQGNPEAWRAVLDPEPAPVLLPGDANLDGIVNREDLRRLDVNMGLGAFWYQGNFDGVGRVDENDRAILMANFVPEPSSLALAIAIPLSFCCTHGVFARARARVQPVGG